MRAPRRSVPGEQSLFASGLLCGLGFGVPLGLVLGAALWAALR